jgi:hypothetical protein
MSKNLFLSFGDGRQGFKYAGRRLCREVSDSGWNSDQMLLDSDSGSRLIGAEWDLHQNWMTQTKRGFGLWVWKPLIIKHALLGTFGEYDRVFYLDAGSQFSLKTVHARERFDRYLELADLSGGFAFTHIDGQSGIDDFSEEAWGKHELHKALDAKGEVLKTNQILAGCLILTRESIDVVTNWMNWSTKEDYFFLRNPSQASFQSSNFVAHRHDQSILSLLSIKHKENLHIFSSDMMQQYFFTHRRVYNKKSLVFPHKLTPFELWLSRAAIKALENS